MKKFFLSAILIVSFFVFAVFYKPGSSTLITTTGTPSPGTGSKNGYKDGTFNGNAISEYYGTIQVAAVISNGKLVDVKFLQYPTDRPTSTMINNNALPQLRTEAIAAQSAKIDAVSGASETSPAFIKSLESALVAASA